MQDAETARDWYAERSPFAARGFLLALDAAVTAVMQAPSRWPERQYQCRHYVFQSGYPYSVIYRVGQSVEIIAVAHQHRHPEYWAAR